MVEDGGGAEQDETTAMEEDDDGELLGEGEIGTVDPEKGLVSGVERDVLGEDGGGVGVVVAGGGRDGDSGTGYSAVRVFDDL